MNRQTNKNNNNKRRKQRSRRKAARQVVPSLAALRPPLPDCTKNWLLAVTAPFALFDSGQEVCLPDIRSRRSYKISVRWRGVFDVGTAGHGFAYVKPNTPSSDGVLGSYTTSAYAGDGSPVTVGTGVVNYSNPKIPFVTASVPQWRCVGCGLRVKYTGKELDRAGQLVVSVRPTDENIGTTVFTDILAEYDTQVYSVDRRWKTICYKPMNDADLGWRSPGAGNQYGILYAGAVGATPGTSFAFEAVNFLEYVPTESHNVPTITASHSDVPGMSAIMNELASTPTSSGGVAIAKKMLVGLGSHYNIPASFSKALLNYVM